MATNAQITRRRIAFLHTAYPAIAPLMQFYSEHAADLEITNLLEDGILRMLGEGRRDEAEGRLRSMMGAARRTYGVELAMITCSSVPLATARRLSDEFEIPVIKIDGPMARRAVEIGPRVGVAVTFHGTVEPTTALIRDTAGELGRSAEVTVKMACGAYEALMRGDSAGHDAVLLKTIEELAASGVDSIVLAQVSMARVRTAAAELVSVPVLSSFDTSLEAIRASARVALQDA